MAISHKNNNALLYFLLGAMAAVVAVSGFLMFDGHMPSAGVNQASSIDLKVDTPQGPIDPKTVEPKTTEPK